MVVLDGRLLAARRAPHIRRRAGEVRAACGRSPVLLLVAFAEANGRAPHVGAKLDACAAVGVAAHPLLLPPGVSEDEAARRVRAAAEAHAPDAVFLQVPYPAGFDGSKLEAEIPPHADVDVMTPSAVERYMRGDSAMPPVTVTAGVLLLEGYDVDVAGRCGVIVAHDSPFSRMFAEALQRRGARMDAPLHPEEPRLLERLGGAGLVVVAAGSPGLVPVSSLDAGAIVIDAGYYNPGGRGDVDTAPGAGHLAALAPVPGGIGPMTVSALLERVVQLAEATCTTVSRNTAPDSERTE